MGFRIFINYAREDAAEVAAMHDFLLENGFEPWMDVNKLIGGELWWPALRREIRRSHLFLACVSSRAIDKKGIIEDERKEALERQRNLPATEIYLIPVRLEPLELPEDLEGYQVVDWFKLDGRDRLLAAVKEAFNRQPGGIQPAPAQSESAQNVPAQGMAIDVKFLYRGHPAEILHLQSGGNFDIQTPETRRRAIDYVENALPHDRSRINVYFCLLGDHLYERYDYFLVEELLDLAAKHQWGENRYIVINKRIGDIADHDPASLSLWFNSVKSGGAADILEILYKPGCPDAIQLSKAVDRSIIRYQRIQDLPRGEEWKCVVSNSSRGLAGFMRDFSPPKDYQGNIVIIVESSDPASQTRLVKTTWEKYSGRNIMVVTSNGVLSSKLFTFCNNWNLRMIECRGPFELRYLLLQLNSLPQQV